jgi:ubiquinone/menaquinone biosynthesis C-methylase UbiE
MTQVLLKRFDNQPTDYQQARIAFWDAVAKKMDVWSGLGGYYHRKLAQNYQSLVTPGQRVLEIGCGRGDLLAALNPALGVGVDFSIEMVSRARERHPDLSFVLADAHNLDLNGTFDIIILSDLLNDVWDVQSVLQQLIHLTATKSRVIINSYSRLWELPLTFAGKLSLSNVALYQNWLTVKDIINLLNLVGFETIRSWPEILWPVSTPILDVICNRFLVKLWPFQYFALTNFVVARPQPQHNLQVSSPLVSVIIPARNEDGNISQIFARIPDMGMGTEIIFVEGHSTDDTYQTIEREMIKYPQRRCKLLRQTGVGKGDAVRLGFAKAIGDILMILDADLSVPPEDLTRFYDVIYSGRTDFVNGVRLVYPIEDQAMRYLNLIGNKFFSIIFSWLIGQPIKDTLCGTKVLWKSDYECIVANRTYFGEFDPFGDFDLLFGAAKINLKILDLPIRYRKRIYGRTNIHRWKHGWLLLKMVAFAAKKIKFV